MPGAPMLLTLSGMRKSFGGAKALTNAHLEIAQGEVHALVGENGAGKSTLMAIVSGSLSPYAGSMNLLGTEYSPQGPLAARNLGVSLVHQELALAPHLSIEANVCLGNEQSRFGFTVSKAHRVNQILTELGYRHLDPGTRVNDLGVAERQIIEIARALMSNAKLILMDEPTSSLPAKDVERLFQVIGHLKKSGVSVVYISHFLEEVEQISDRITVLRDGVTVAAGLPGNTSRGEILQAMVGRPVTEIFPAKSTKDLSDALPETLSAAISKSCAEAFPETNSNKSDTLLSIRNWVSRPGAEPVSIELMRGQILGIAGLVGSGRSSLLRSIFGLKNATSGEIQINGKVLHASKIKPSEAMAAGIGFLSEDRKEEGLALSMSIRNNVTLANLKQFQGNAGILRLAAESQTVRDLCKELHVRYQGPEQRAGALSGGNQQKVALARLQLGNAEVWLLDEPTRGVDVGAKAEIYRMIAKKAAAGITVIWAGSYLPELFGVCDRLAVLHKGRLSPVREVKDWTESEVMAWATSGKEVQG